MRACTHACSGTQCTWRVVSRCCMQRICSAHAGCMPELQVCGVGTRRSGLRCAGRGGGWFGRSPVRAGGAAPFRVPMPAHARARHGETAVVVIAAAVAQWGGGQCSVGAQHAPRMLPPPPPPPPGLPPPPPPPPLLVLPKPLAGPRPGAALLPFLRASGCTHSTWGQRCEGVGTAVLGRDEPRATARGE